MSSATLRISSTETGFPRVSGDELSDPAHFVDGNGFSPRERG